MSKARICIDAGHGANTPGKRSAPFLRAVSHKNDTRKVIIKKGYQLQEHCANAGVAEYLEKELIKRGYAVCRSGYTTAANWRKDVCPEDPSDDVRARQAVIKKLGCDICISIHFNASGSGTVFNGGNGIETYYHADPNKVGDGRSLAETIHRHIKGVAVQVDRGCKASSAIGMCNSRALKVKAACLVELAFMTNQREAEELFCSPKMWQKYAVKIADGVEEYFA